MRLQHWQLEHLVPPESWEDTSCQSSRLFSFIQMLPFHASSWMVCIPTCLCLALVFLHTYMCICHTFTYSTHWYTTLHIDALPINVALLFIILCHLGMSFHIYTTMVVDIIWTFNFHAAVYIPCVILLYPNGLWTPGCLLHLLQLHLPVLFFLSLFLAIMGLKKCCFSAHGIRNKAVQPQSPSEPAYPDVLLLAVGT